MQEQRRKAVGATIRRLRVEDGMHQADLAQACDLGRSYIARIERGDANPTLDTLWAIADGLGVGLSELVSAEPF